MRTALVVIPLFLFAALHPAAMAQSDRIAARIDNRQMAVLSGSVHPKAQPQYDRGRVETSLPLEYITLLTKPSPEQQASVQRLLAEQQDPTSHNYHRWLTAEQYADRFGLSQDDVEKLTGWLRSEGFTIVQVARGRDWIAFSGTAALVENALQTEIHYYDVDDEMHFANATELSVPAALAGIVTGFRGLHDFRWKPMSMRVPATGAIIPDLLRPFYNLGGQHFLAPDDLATIYALDSLYSSGIDGTGMKLVVVGQTDITMTDIDQFRSGFHLSKNDPVVTNLPGHKVSNSDLDEAYLDLEWSGAVARNAQIIYVNSSNVFDSAVYAIDHDLAPVISMSYGGCESENSGFIPSNEITMEEANAKGITFLASSGDSGAAGCDSDTKSTASQGLGVNYPASSPEVTGVGGTEFNEGSGTYWSGTNGANLGSALSYIPEMGWNDTAQNGTLSASGGGASSCGQSSGASCTGGFPKPAWQTGAGVPKDGVRDVPDVSMTASPDHDGYLLCTDDNSTNPVTHTCANGVANDNFIVGGTSASTPVFAGIVTLLNQSLENIPPAGLGNINPTLYQLAKSTSNGVFHDVTTGDNKVPCTKGSTGCPNGGSIGYSAGPGYDQVTGLGSVDANTLVAAWDAAAGKKSPTATSLSLTASTITASTAVSFTADVTHAAGTKVPSGTVTFNNGTTKLGSATLNSSAQATFQTSSLAGGSYSVTAAYSGDNNYTASTSSADPLTVEDFAPPTANPTTVNVTAPGGSGMTAITITPIAGFNQAVSFSCNGLPLEAACSFNPSSVTPSGKAITTTLTISTMAASAALREDWVGRAAARFYALLLPGLLGLVIMASGDGKRKWRGMPGLWLTAILCALTLCLPACGGGSSGGGSGNSGTPVGNSPVTITATAGSTLAHSVQVTLSVK